VSALRRELGLVGAVGLGLGSILGTGVFVAVALAAGPAGAALPAAVLIAAGVATLNGLSSAQLAAVHPVAGGTYAYGRRFLAPWAGFLAGVAFLAAKGASAATAALGVAGYLLQAAGAPAGLQVPLALAAVAGVTAAVLGGVRRSSAANLALLAVTLAALAAFVAAGVGALAGGAVAPPAASGIDLAGVGTAAALAFVAYTGYGRVATLGEEITDPRRTIPRAVVATLVASAAIYLAVVGVAVATVGADAFAATAGGAAAPLAEVARAWAASGVGPAALPALLAVGAVTAMAGVTLNLILGLSRVAFAMARDGEAPAGLARLDASGRTPTRAVLAVAGVVAALVATGDVQATWTFSAVTVLLYYAVTNLAALRVREGRFVPRAVSVAGLLGCLALAAFVAPAAWAAAGVVAAVALGVRAAARR
jgi:APA family basic amino acid/polyamine antiporter